MAEFFTSQFALLAMFLATFLPFIIIVSLMLILMWRAHVSSDEKFNIYDTLIDSSTGKASVERIGIWLAILSTTWWFFDKVAHSTAGWEEMVAYAGVLGLTKIASSYISAKYHPHSPPEKGND